MEAPVQRTTIFLSKSSGSSRRRMNPPKKLVRSVSANSLNNPTACVNCNISLEPSTRVSSFYIDGKNVDILTVLTTLFGQRKDAKTGYYERTKFALCFVCCFPFKGLYKNVIRLKELHKPEAILADGFFADIISRQNRLKDAPAPEPALLPEVITVHSSSDGSKKNRPKLLVCRYCRKIYRRIPDAEQPAHLKACKAIFDRRCDICNLYFLQISDVQIHVGDAHGKAPHYLSKKCLPKEYTMASEEEGFSDDSECEMIAIVENNCVRKHYVRASIRDARRKSRNTLSASASTSGSSTSSSGSDCGKTVEPDPDVYFEAVNSVDTQNYGRFVDSQTAGVIYEAVQPEDVGVNDENGDAADEEVCARSITSENEGENEEHDDSQDGSMSPEYVDFQNGEWDDEDAGGQDKGEVEGSFGEVESQDEREFQNVENSQEEEEVIYLGDLQVKKTIDGAENSQEEEEVVYLGDSKNEEEIDGDKDLQDEEEIDDDNDLQDEEEIDDDNDLQDEEEIDDSEESQDEEFVDCEEDSQDEDGIKGAEDSQEEGVNTEDDNLQEEGVNTEEEDLQEEGVNTEEEDLQEEGVNTEDEDLQDEGVNTEDEDLQDEGIITEDEDSQDVVIISEDEDSQDEEIITEDEEIITECEDSQDGGIDDCEDSQDGGIEDCEDSQDTGNFNSRDGAVNLQVVSDIEDLDFDEYDDYFSGMDYDSDEYTNFRRAKRQMRNSPPILDRFDIIKARCERNDRIAEGEESEDDEPVGFFCKGDRRNGFPKGFSGIYKTSRYRSKENHEIIRIRKSGANGSTKASKSKSHADKAVRSNGSKRGYKKRKNGKAGARISKNWKSQKANVPKGKPAKKGKESKKTKVKKIKKSRGYDSDYEFNLKIKGNGESLAVRDRECRVRKAAKYTYDSDEDSDI